MTIIASLRAGGGPDGYLRQHRSPRIEAFLHTNNGPKTDGYLRRDRSFIDAVLSVAFPTQFSGLRYFLGTVKELCLVALGDAPAGDQWRIRKNATDYAVYLVDTTDPNASQVRIQTSAGLKAARLKT